METAINWVLENSWLAAIAFVAVGYSVIWSSRRTSQVWPRPLAIKSERVLSWIVDAAFVAASLLVVILVGLAALASAILLLLLGLLRAAIHSLSSRRVYPDKRSQTYYV